jgi:hypothetical protein
MCIKKRRRHTTVASGTDTEHKDTIQSQTSPGYEARKKCLGFGWERNQSKGGEPFLVHVIDFLLRIKF